MDLNVTCKTKIFRKKKRKELSDQYDLGLAKIL